MTERRADPPPADAAAPRPGARPVPGRRLPAALPSARLAARTAPRGAREIVDAPPDRARCRRSPRAQARAARHLPPRRDRRCRRPCGPRRRAACCTCARSEARARSSACVATRACSSRRARRAAGRWGRPLRGDAADVLGGEEEHDRRARRSRQRYGLGRELFERAMDLMRVDMCYLEVTPQGVGADSSGLPAERSGGRGRERPRDVRRRPLRDERRRRDREVVVEGPARERGGSRTRAPAR